MKSLTQDESVIRNALVNSTVVVIVDDRIKSLTKTGNRATIILREITSDVPESEVRAIFEYENCKPIHSVRSDIGDTWFVVMESEEDAKDTLLDLKLKKRTFRGQSVKCRLKSEQSVRAFYSGSAPTTGGIAPMINPNPMIPGGMMIPGAPLPSMYNMVLPPAFVPAIPPFVTSTPVYAPSQPTPVDVTHHNSHVNSSTAAAATATGESRSHTVSNTAAGSDSTHNRANKQTSGGNNKNTDSHTRKGKHNSGETATAAANPGNTVAKVNNKKIEMNSSNFPPLHEGGAPVAGSTNPVTLVTTSEIPIATPGYKSTFHQYTYEDIIAIVRNVQDATLPKTIVSNLCDLLYFVVIIMMCI